MTAQRRIPASLATAALTGALVLGAVPAAAAATPPASSTLVSESGYGDVTVRCPGGHVATGGGVDVDHDDEVTAFRSRPTADGRGWEGGAWGEVEVKKPKKGKKESKKGSKDTDEEIQGLPVTVYAVCFPG
ncbi:hypothetical protein QNO07_20700 [Streptomyces sp. 549]|uniref:hypothetical protein n=1 Tax=Streptomyces sp. 549 TaxID=3049076 RepID=UPI0024C451D3|nr:hypothetical protein [Streptomyces sp. 549]MDK1475807.1 hypothetical protein [Streptomyces sp. 549]